MPPGTIYHSHQQPSYEPEFRSPAVTHDLQQLDFMMASKGVRSGNGGMADAGDFPQMSKVLRGPWSGVTPAATSSTRSSSSRSDSETSILNSIYGGDPAFSSDPRMHPDYEMTSNDYRRYADPMSMIHPTQSASRQPPRSTAPLPTRNLNQYSLTTTPLPDSSDLPLSLSHLLRKHPHSYEDLEAPETSELPYLQDRPTPVHTKTAPEVRTSVTRPSAYRVPTAPPAVSVKSSDRPKPKRESPMPHAGHLNDLDKIDELDESDPNGLSWHQGGPYEGIDHLNAPLPPTTVAGQSFPAQHLLARNAVQITKSASPSQEPKYVIGVGGSLNLQPGQLLTTVPNSVLLAPYAHPSPSHAATNRVISYVGPPRFQGNSAIDVNDYRTQNRTPDQLLQKYRPSITHQNDSTPSFPQPQFQNTGRPNLQPDVSYQAAPPNGATLSPLSGLSTPALHGRSQGAYQQAVASTASQGGIDDQYRKGHMSYQGPLPPSRYPSAPGHTSWPSAPGPNDRAAFHPGPQTTDHIRTQPEQLRSRQHRTPPTPPPAPDIPMPSPSSTSSASVNSATRPQPRFFPKRLVMPTPLQSSVTSSPSQDGRLSSNTSKVNLQRRATDIPMVHDGNVKMQKLVKKRASLSQPPPPPSLPPSTSARFEAIVKEGNLRQGKRLSKRRSVF